MTLRRVIAASLCAAALAAVPGFVRAQQGPGPSPAGVAADSSRGPVSAARRAHEAALRLRQAGDPAAALRTIEEALSSIPGTPAGLTPAAGDELAVLRQRLSDLYDATQQDLRTVRAEPGNEADHQVLNAQALDVIADVEPQDHELVAKWMDFFMGAGRSTFERWLKRSGRYMELFRSVLQREGLPPDLVHLVFVESGFNVNARSVSAAVGPWQFLRSTGKFFGLTVDQWVDERKDPEKATVAAARYLKHLYSIFGDWPLALASYNAGEGTVLRAIKAQGTTNYWDLKLPRQTEDYVPQFMAAMTIARDPARYGFSAVELDAPMDFDEVALKGAVDLRALARLTDCSLEELKSLNPAVLHTTARNASGITTVRVPKDKGQLLMRRLQGGEPLPAVTLTLKHRVRKGETLTSIARQYSIGAPELARVNGIGKKHPLRRGMVLTVPSSPRAGRAPELVVDEADPRTKTDYVPELKRGLPAKLDGHSTPDGRTVVTVERSETLASIAARHGVTTQDLMRWNRLKSARVTRGMRLKVRTDEAVATLTSPADSAQIATLKAPKPVKSSAAAKRRGASALVTHTVRPGETLSGIARRHGVSVAALKRANGMSGTAIRAGQRLKLPT